MKHTKKLSAFVLAAIVLASALSGCSQKGTGNNGESSQTAQSGADKSSEPAKENLNFSETGFPIVNQKITLRMMGSKAAIQGAWEDLSFFEEMERLTNIHFEFDTPPAEVYAEKKNLAFASGDYPDLFFGGDLKEADEVMYGEAQKILVPLGDLIEKYAPNFKQYGVENPQMIPAITHSSGNIYTLPMVIPRASFFVLTGMSWINENWLEQVGLTLPTNTDELYTVLKSFKGKDLNGDGVTDEIPVSGKGVLQGGILGAFGLLGTDVQVKDDKVQYNPMTDAYKEYLIYANKLYTEGLLDNETFTQTDQQLSAKGAAMRLGLFSKAAAFVIVPMERALEYTGLTPLTSPLNDTPMTKEQFSVNRGAFAITTANKYPAETMRWVDYLYSQEGARLAGIGVEGKDWEWVDKEKLTTKPLTPEGSGGEEYRGGNITPDCGTTLPRAEIIAAPAEDPVTMKLFEDSDRVREYGVIPFPQMYYSIEDADQIATLKVDIDSYVSQMEARFITGEEPISSWDTYVEKLKALNVEKYIETYQRNYDTYQASAKK